MIVAKRTHNTLHLIFSGVEYEERHLLGSDGVVSGVSVATFRKSILASSSIPRANRVKEKKTVINFHQILRHHIPEDSALRTVCS